MTEIPISPNIWKLAEAILTPKQLQVLDMRERRGYSQNMMAITLNCTRSNVREHHRAATKKLLDAIEAAGGDIDLALETALAVHYVLETPEETFDIIGVEETRPASEETPSVHTVIDWRLTELIDKKETE